MIPLSMANDISRVIIKIFFATIDKRKLDIKIDEFVI